VGCEKCNWTGYKYPSVEKMGSLSYQIYKKSRALRTQNHNGFCRGLRTVTSLRALKTTLDKEIPPNSLSELLLIAYNI
jgi:hypothetical protein